MMQFLLDLVIGLLLVTGATFCFVAAIGLRRLPDLYTKMHAASKAGALGSGLMLIAVAIYSLDVAVGTRAVAGVVFLLLTTPVSAHLLARAAYFRGHEPCDLTSHDELAGHYSGKTPHLSGSHEEAR